MRGRRVGDKMDHLAKKRKKQKVVLKDVAMQIHVVHSTSLRVGTGQYGQWATRSGSSYVSHPFPSPNIVLFSLTFSFSSPSQRYPGAYLNSYLKSTLLCFLHLRILLGLNTVLEVLLVGKNRMLSLQFEILCGRTRGCCVRL
jgi:hypothetical protein